MTKSYTWTFVCDGCRKTVKDVETSKPEGWANIFVGQGRKDVCSIECARSFLLKQLESDLEGMFA